MTSSSAPDRRTAPLHLWRAASALLHTLFALFGGPEKLAAKHTLTAAAHRLTAGWLRTAEALMRRLLFVEASAYAKGEASKPRAARARVKRAVASDPDRPESWRVSFNCVTPDRRRPRRNGTNDQTPAPELTRHAGGGAGGPRFYSAWPLAERFEALIRVHNDPALYAKRLARRLHAAPKLIASVLSAPEELAHRVAEDAVEELRLLCQARTPLFDTT